MKKKTLHIEITCPEAFFNEHMGQTGMTEEAFCELIERDFRKQFSNEFSEATCTARISETP